MPKPEPNSIEVDHKFWGLRITISEEEFKALAEAECEKRNKPKLLEKKFNYISYLTHERRCNEKKNGFFGLCFIFAAILFVILGVWKAFELLWAFFP